MLRLYTYFTSVDNLILKCYFGNLCFAPRSARCFTKSDCAFMGCRYKAKITKAA